MSGLSIDEVAWATDRDVLKRIRTEVFVHEQQVPEAEEWDDDDAGAVHLLATTDTGEAVGTARILANDKITRMAVVAAFRAQGIGTALLHAALDLLRTRGATRAWLHAQTGAQAFYQAQGFKVTGETFTEAGIVHVPMAKSLAPACLNPKL